MCSTRPHSSAWIDKYAEPAEREADELVESDRVCANCYLLIRDEITVPWLIRESNRKSVPETMSPWREDNVEQDPAGKFCRGGSDGACGDIYRPSDGEMDMGQVRELTRNAAETMSKLGYEVDPDEAVGNAEELKSDNPFGDDTIILEAVEDALGD